LIRLSGSVVVGGGGHRTTRRPQEPDNRGRALNQGTKRRGRSRPHRPFRRFRYVCSGVQLLSGERGGVVHLAVRKCLLELLPFCVPVAFGVEKTDLELTPGLLLPLRVLAITPD
jgi:hypothetical protein